MVCLGNRGEGAGYGKVRKPGHICQQLVDESICHELPAESAAMRCAYIIHRSVEVYGGGSGTERPRSFWMQMIIDRNHRWAVNNDCMHLAYNC